MWGGGGGCGQGEQRLEVVFGSLNERPLFISAWHFYWMLHSLTNSLFIASFVWWWNCLFSIKNKQTVGYIRVDMICTVDTFTQTSIIISCLFPNCMPIIMTLIAAGMSTHPKHLLLRWKKSNYLVWSPQTKQRAWCHQVHKAIWDPSFES